MSDAAPLVLGVLVVCVWLAGLVALDVFTPDDVRAWRRLAGLRGYMTMRTRIERAADRSHWVGALRDALDIERLLAVALRRQTAVAFLSQTAALVLGVFAVLLIVDAAARTVSGAWPLAPLWTLVFAAALGPLAVIELRRAAQRARKEVSRTLIDMTMMLAVITDSRGFQLDDAVRMLGRCADAPAVSRLLSGWDRRLVQLTHPGTVELYRALGAAYRIPALRLLADAAAAANTGISEQQVYTGLAIAMYKDRLADARVRAARSRVLITLPVAAMLLPLLLLIGAPTLSAITGGL